VGDVYMPALRAGAHIATMELDVTWDDIGSIAAYIAANIRWLEATGRTAHVAEAAHVDAEVRLERAVVGAGARVRGSGLLRDVVVWPGVEATASLERAVAFADGRVARCA
jgi:mannose-1-phosphate guanylyltransferase